MYVCTYIYAQINAPIYACMHIVTDSCISAYIHNLNVYLYVTYIHQNHMMLTLGTVVSCDQENHVAPHFDHLDLGNTLVPFIMPSVSCDADTGADSKT